MSGEGEKSTKSHGTPEMSQGPPLLIPLLFTWFTSHWSSEVALFFCFLMYFLPSHSTASFVPPILSLFFDHWNKQTNKTKPQNYELHDFWPEKLLSNTHDQAKTIIHVRTISRFGFLNIKVKAHWLFIALSEWIFPFVAVISKLSNFNVSAVSFCTVQLRSAVLSDLFLSIHDFVFFWWLYCHFSFNFSKCNNF